MAYAQQAGLANPKCQLYMLFYYIGPALVATQMKCQSSSSSSNQQIKNTKFTTHDGERLWPSKVIILKASGIALFDIFAQSMVYTGNNLAGPTIFSIIYSSVTIWTALYSKVLLSRSLSKLQWFGVLFVVLGLSLTAKDSSKMGDSVFLGAILILVGSSFHGLTYVLSELLMTAKHEGKEREHISIRANCAVQGIVATVALLGWQVVYTFPHRQSLILDSMDDAGTTPLYALAILVTIALANLLHSVTFYSTLKNCPGGSTSAGVLKGLQAVLVFAASSLILCGRLGGMEMCWSRSKFISLVVVVFGILFYGAYTEKERGTGVDDIKKSTRGLSMRQNNGGYNRIEHASEGGDRRILCV
jgi:drug/metabolite transporter (DMT)-like permease